MVAPVRERGLKFLGLKPLTVDNGVAPVRERGLKYDRKGELMNPPLVAPVRERGLKSTVSLTGDMTNKRSLP